MLQKPIKKRGTYSVLLLLSKFSIYYVYSYVQVGIISYAKVLLQIVRYSYGGHLSTGTRNLHVASHMGG